MSVRSKSLHPAWNQTSSFGSKGITGGIKCAACTNTPSSASLQCQHTWEGICYPLFIQVMLLLLLEMPQGFIWDRQHTKLGTEGTAPLIPTNRESLELWAHTLNTAGWLCHLHPCTPITSHRSAAQNCQHFIPYIIRSLEWVRFLMRNLGQNDWFRALVWKNHNNVGGRGSNYVTLQLPRTPFGLCFFCLFYQNQKHWASKPLVDPSGVCTSSRFGTQYINYINNLYINNIYKNI